MSTVVIEWLLLIAQLSQTQCGSMQGIKHGGRDAKFWAELNEQTGQ